MNIFIGIVVIVILIFGLAAITGAPYVPSRKKFLDKAFFELYKLSKKDKLLDIGSGDGVVLRQASKLGARAIGYEINPFLVVISKLLSINDQNVTTKFVDYNLANLPNDVTVVYVFATGRDINKISRWLQKQVNDNRQTVYLISLGFEIKGKSPIKVVEPYLLYRFDSLHKIKPQV